MRNICVRSIFDSVFYQPCNRLVPELSMTLVRTEWQ